MKFTRFVLCAVCICVAVAMPVCGKTIGKKAPSSNPDTAAISQAVALLDQYKAIQQNLHVQNSELAYAMRKAVVLANLLIGADGKLNVSLCQAAKAAFVPAKPLKYEVNIGHVLDQLDASWQPFFDQVVKPKDPANISNVVLRGLFGLPADEALTDRHAKAAVLAAMFAPYNQGPVGDCFAVADLIRDHEEYYRHSANDYAQLIQKGYITRTVDKQPDNFFFVATIADEDVNNAISVDASGKVQGGNVQLLDVPGFAAANSVMGGTHIASLAQNVLKNLFQGNVKGKVQTSPARVITALAREISAATPGADSNALAAQGLYAFSSLTNNPVLRAAETIFAAMAEDRPRDYVRGNVNYAVAQAMKSVWDSLAKNPQTPLFQKTFADKFNASFRLIYNANVPLAQVASDGSSSAGAFQLYKRVAGNPAVIGTRVRTPQEFEQLVADVIASTESSLGYSSSVHAISTQLTHFVQNDAFLKAVLWDYESANKREPDPVKNYEKFARTPMQSCDGDNPYEINDIDTGTVYEYDVKTYTPKNTQDLIKWCLDLAKTAPVVELMPMDSPQHAFNFDPTNPDIVAFVQSGKTSDYWIRQMLNVPCMQVSTRTIDAKTQTALSDSMLLVIQDLLWDTAEYHAMVAKLAQKPMSVQSYAQALMDGIKKLVWLDAAQSNQLARILDARLIQSLPSSDQVILENAAIRFAFTNWNDGTKDIYFCAFFNPRTLQVGFGCMDEDKTNLFPMDETEWVNNQQWDVDLRPYAPPTLMAVGQ